MEAPKIPLCKERSLSFSSRISSNCSIILRFFYQNIKYEAKKETKSMRADMVSFRLCAFFFYFSIGHFTSVFDRFITKLSLVMGRQNSSKFPFRFSRDLLLPLNRLTPGKKQEKLAFETGSIEFLEANIGLKLG